MGLPLGEHLDGLCGFQQKSHSVTITVFCLQMSTQKKPERTPVGILDILVADPFQKTPAPHQRLCFLRLWCHKNSSSDNSRLINLFSALHKKLSNSPSVTLKAVTEWIKGEVIVQGGPGWGTPEAFLASHPSGTTSGAQRATKGILNVLLTRNVWLEDQEKSICISIDSKRDEKMSKGANWCCN